MFSFLDGGVFAAAAMVIVVVLLVVYISRRYQIAGPNEALIIAGASGSKVRQGSAVISKESDAGIRVVVGAGAVILPIVNKAYRLRLRTYQSQIKLDDGVTSQGIRVKVNANAVFKIGRQPEQIRAAAERFLDQEDAIDQTVTSVLVGSMRGIVGKLAINDLVTNRDELVKQVSEEARRELTPLGIELDVLNIQDITDEGFPGQQSYIAQLGVKNYQVARKEAEVATAQAQMEIIAAQREQQLKAADAKAQTDAASATAAQAGPLAQAEATREVTRRQTELAELEALRREKELLASTVKVAAADAAAIVARAHGDRDAKIAAAQAEGEKVRIEGMAAADAIAARGEAEAEVLALRAQAYQAFNNAAIVSIILEKLPEIVRAAAEPIASIDSLTILSTDGASEIVRTATNAVAQGSEVVRSLTGIDLRSMVDAAMNSETAGKAEELMTDLRTRREARKAATAAETARIKAVEPIEGSPSAAAASQRTAATTSTADGDESLDAAPSAPVLGDSWARIDAILERTGTLARVRSTAGTLRGIPGYRRLATATVADLATSNRTPASLRDAFDSLPQEVQVALYPLTVQDVVEHYAG